MDERDLALRNRVYALLVELGRAPTFDEIGADEAALRRLHEHHALVLEPAGRELRMLNPFSAVPTPYRVQADGREWHGNCVWDAFGIPAALGVDGHVSATCADCSAQVEIDLVDGHPEPTDFLAHFLVPAHSWWDDIVFT
jgi:hypothetical protein